MLFAAQVLLVIGFGCFAGGLIALNLGVDRRRRYEQSEGDVRYGGEEVQRGRAQDRGHRRRRLAAP